MKKLMLSAIRCSFVFTAALAALSFGYSASANLVTNPGFETGDLTGWTAQGTGVNTTKPHSGLYQASLGDHSTVSQTIPTVAGATYDLSFWIAHGPAGTDEGVGIFWNGSGVDGFALFDNQPYFHLTYSGLVATGSSTEIRFDDFGGLNDGGTIYLDDVLVTKSGVGVPEPFSTLWLALPLAGLLGFAGFRTAKRV
jgi:hypothetical protein